MTRLARRLRLGGKQNENISVSSQYDGNAPAHLSPVRRQSISNFPEHRVYRECCAASAAVLLIVTTAVKCGINVLGKPSEPIKRPDLFLSQVGIGPRVGARRSTVGTIPQHLSFP